MRSVFLGRKASGLVLVVYRSSLMMSFQPESHKAVASSRTQHRIELLYNTLATTRDQIVSQTSQALRRGCECEQEQRVEETPPRKFDSRERFIFRAVTPLTVKL